MFHLHSFIQTGLCDTGSVLCRRPLEWIFRCTDVYEGKGIEDGKKSIAYSLTFERPDRTLTDEEINGAMDKIIDFVQKKNGAELRK